VSLSTIVDSDTTAPDQTARHDREEPNGEKLLSSVYDSSREIRDDSFHLSYLTKVAFSSRFCNSPAAGEIIRSEKADLSPLMGKMRVIRAGKELTITSFACFPASPQSEIFFKML
jgi:hypothetical protein